MKRPHQQSHATLRSRGHVANKKCNISTFTRPMDPKLSRLVTQDEGNPPTNSGGTLIGWSCDKSKIFYLHFHKAQGPQTQQVGDQNEKTPLNMSCDTSVTSSRDSYKFVACIKEVFKVMYYFLAVCLYRKKYPDRLADSVSRIIHFCDYHLIRRS